MNRSNIGNSVANGMQILSVASTTATQMHNHQLAQANQPLNNLSEEDRARYVKMQADKMREETARYETGGASPFQHLDDSEASEYQTARAIQMKKFTKSVMDKSTGDEEEATVDELMDDINTEQSRDIRLKLQRDQEWIQKHLKGDDNADN